MCAGESAAGRRAQGARFRLTADLHNVYGPTEATIYATHARIVGAREARSPSDRRSPRHILDESRDPVATGAVGELYLGGVGLARGYLNRPELTAERFVPDPFGAEPSERLYKTGDLCRRRSDGQIDFLGRIDKQVKVRGFRVELGEIEARLAQHSAVHACVVVPKASKRSDTELVAYVVPNGDTPHELLAVQLRETLQRFVPHYMVPGAFVFLPELPLSPNGKLDSAALPAPTIDSYASGRFVAPATEMERRLAEMWAALLDLDRERNQCDGELLRDGRAFVAGDSPRNLIGHGMGPALKIGTNDVFERPVLARISRRTLTEVRGQRSRSEAADAGKDPMGKERRRGE
jgi:hypothetical protein